MVVKTEVKIVGTVHAEAKMNTVSTEATAPLYAVIDLGSNSFHMLIVKQLANTVQVVDKIKQKVRLASGLDEKNYLSEEAIKRGIDCISLFADRLQTIPVQNVKIVATATLRLAENRQTFLEQANRLLPTPIQLLSGKEEAETIYLGVASTSHENMNRLVIDIGGASTELVVGNQHKALQVESLNMGCVTYLNQFFGDGKLSHLAFEHAIDAAKKMLQPYAEVYKTIGWQQSVSGSGTMQALIEMLTFHNKPAVVTLSYLREVKDQLIAFSEIKSIHLPGLTAERVPVLASGLAILIGIFESFEIANTKLSSGALREGLLSQILPNSRNQSLRESVISDLQTIFNIDVSQANLVTGQVNRLIGNVGTFDKNFTDTFKLLLPASQLHEAGLILNYKHYLEHGYYLIKNSSLLTFDNCEKESIALLIKNHAGDVDEGFASHFNSPKKESLRLALAILRIAVILCKNRSQSNILDFEAEITESAIILNFKDKELSKHPLISFLLTQEVSSLKTIGIQLTIA